MFVFVRVRLCELSMVSTSSSSGITISQMDLPPVASTSLLNAAGSSVQYRLSQEEISQIATVLEEIIHPPSTSLLVSNPLTSGNEASIATASNQLTFTQASTDTGTGNAGQYIGGCS